MSEESFQKFTEISKKLLTSTGYRKIEQVNEDIKTLRNCFFNIYFENTKLQAKLDLAVEALGFYGEKDNWAEECFCDDEDIEYLPNGKNSDDLWENCDIHAGKRARQALKQLTEGEG